MTRLLIADDHPIMLSGLEALLRDTDYEVVATARDGTGVLEQLDRISPDILVLDERMPNPSGLEVLRILRSRGDDRPVVLLTADLTDRKLLDAVSLGVEGIVLKESAQTSLLTCLDKVSRGQRWMEPGLALRALDLKFRPGTEVADAARTLSPREAAIVRLVASGLRNRDIASRLSLTEGTVKVYLHRIYEKLDVTNRTELALLAREMPALHGEA